MTTEYRTARALGLVVVLAVFAGCAEHTDEHGHSHDDASHGEEAHEHDGHSSEQDGRSPAVVTRYNEDTELFLEYPALIAGEGSRFAVHLSWLAEYDPVTTGTLTVTLEREGDVVAGFRVPRPTRDGLYTPTIQPREAGTFDIQVAWSDGDRSSVHVIRDVRVYGDRASVPAELTPAPTGDIEFSKEQQWRVPFSTVAVSERRLRDSVPATGRLTALPGHDRTVRAPVPGGLEAPETGWPEPGQKVEAGTVVAHLVPRLGVGTDVASLRLALEEAQGRARLARRELSRLEGLFAQEAVSERRVIEARNEARVAEASLEAARQRLEVHESGDQTAGRPATVPVIAGTAGTVAEVFTGPGNVLDQDEPILRVVNRERLRLEARVPEAVPLQQPTGAWYTLAGKDQRHSVDPEDGARLISAGEVVDPLSRTVQVLFELANDANHRVGTAVEVRVWNGQSTQALAVPLTALQREAGETVVYIASSGETFQRQVVDLGIRSGNYVAVERGLEAGDRVVTKGSYLVRLAAGGDGEVGHGHAH